MKNTVRIFVSTIVLLVLLGVGIGFVAYFTHGFDFSNPDVADPSGDPSGTLLLTIGGKEYTAGEVLPYQTALRVDINAADFSYGVTAKLDLPADFQLSTDLTVYSRRGYEDPEMNTTDVVWNARLAKRFLKGKLSVMIDGFDLLGQLSTIRRTLNGQGRTETWYNTIPRYAMLHAIYRLNVLPKKSRITIDS